MTRSGRVGELCIGSATDARSRRPGCGCCEPAEAALALRTASAERSARRPWSGSPYRRFGSD